MTTKKDELAGVPKKDFLNALLYLNDQARLMEQKLSLKVDHEIDIQYKEQQHTMTTMESFLKTIYRKSQRLAVSTYHVPHRKLS